MNPVSNAYMAKKYADSQAMDAAKLVKLILRREQIILLAKIEAKIRAVENSRL